MQSYIETLGRMISAQVAPHPARAPDADGGLFVGALFRKMPKADGRQIRLCADERRSRPPLCAAFAIPKRAVCVNIFMPCEMLHAMGLTPMFPEGFPCTSPARPASMSSPSARRSPASRRLLLYHKTMIGMAESGVLPAADDRRNDARLRRTSSPGGWPRSIPRR